MASCKTTKPTRSQSSQPEVIRTARSLIGSPYKYGGRGPRAFDCSGLVEYVFKKNGNVVRGSAATMSKKARGIPLSEGKPGDLIFFKKVGKIDHVGIISRRSRNKVWVIHSTSSRGVMEEEILSSTYWQGKVYKVISQRDMVR